MRELIFFLEASLLSLLLTGAILHMSLRRSLLDMPTERGSHEVPKPRLGGIAIVLAFYATAATAAMTGFDPLPGSEAGIFGAAAMIAVVGLIDDLRGLDARLRLVVQLAAAVVVVLSGVILDQLRIPLLGTIQLGPAAVPVTILWITAIVNFYNFIDGLDGLAAGVGMIAAAFIVFLSVAAGDRSQAIIYAAIAGALFGFLRYNFPPARIFMGDCGSTFIGFMFAVLSISGARSGVPAFVTLLLMGGVLGDAALTLARRAIQRKRIFTAHRTHYYQRLTDLGLSHKQVTILEYMIAALLGGSAFLLVSGENEFVSGLAVIWTGFFLWAVFRIRKLEKGGEGGSAWRIFSVALTDLVLIAASYTLSYMIRLNFSFPEAETRTMIVSLPIVIVVRTAVFYYYGLYKAVWRYTTFDDIVRIFRAVAVGSAIMVVLFTFLFRFESFPRSAFLIDMFILTVFMAGARVATRWFHELPAHEEVEGRRIVIGETGHLAEAVLHEIKQTKGMSAVGWLDDRRSMHGRMIHGIPVLGSIGEIESIAADHRIDEIVISTSFAGRIGRDRIGQLERFGVPVRILGDSMEQGESRRKGPEPFDKMSVAAAGNGPVVRDARTLFARNSSLSIITDDPLVVSSVRDSSGRRVASYLGLLEERTATIRLIEEISPDLVFVDFDTVACDLSNPVEAFLRKTVFPLERLAAAASSSGSGMVVISRRSNDPVDDLRRASMLGEAAARMAFSGSESKLLIIRTDGEIGPEELCRVADRLAHGPAVMWEVRSVGSSEEAVVERVEEGPAPDYASGMLMEVSRALAGGDTEELSRILLEVQNLDEAEKHERG
jgi:UDP-GlcNAc:undecaprenyl-phosphate GlcNAc-1-phosphate transferase